MGESTELNKSLQLLDGLELGGRPITELAAIAEDLDPVLLYGIVTMLRANYPASDPAASAVLERVVALSRSYRGFVEQCKEGETDPVGEWMRKEIDLRGFRGRNEGFLTLLIDKLES